MEANFDLIKMLIIGVGTVVWYLLRQKDAQQAAEIKLLWEKHDSDARELQELKLKLAERHYEKTELDVKFNELKTTFREGFAALGTQFERLSNVLLDHMRRDLDGPK